MSRHLRSLLLRLAAYGSGMRPAGCQLLSSQARRPAGSCRTDYAIRLRSAAVSSDSQQPSAHDISRRVTQIISSLQLPAHVAGYRYARECILMTLEDPSVADSVTKILYPAVARKYHTTWTSVERDIRNAVGNCLEALRRAHGRLQLYAPPAKSRADSNHCRPRAL